MKALSAYAPWFDNIAVSASALCAIHCLSLPVLLAFLPALGATIFGQESFHVLLLWLVLPLSLIALFLGCRAQKDWPVALMGFAGLAAARRFGKAWALAVMVFPPETAGRCGRGRLSCVRLPVTPPRPAS